MKAPVNTKMRKPENAKTGGINLWTRKRRKRENGENGENAKTAKTGKTRKRENGENPKTRKRRKRENGENKKTAKTGKTRKRENGENPKTAKSVPVFWFSISRFLVFSVFSVFWFSRFLVFSFRWPHPSGQVAFFMCLVSSGHQERSTRRLRLSKAGRVAKLQHVENNSSRDPFPISRQHRSDLIWLHDFPLLFPSRNASGCRM